MSGRIKKYKIPIYVEPGAKLPLMSEPDAIGFDVFCNNIIEVISGKKEVLWDFVGKPDKRIARIVSVYDGKPAIMLPPGEDIMVDFGLILGMSRNWFCEIAPRSSTANDLIWVSHERVPIDPGYRGKPGTRILNRSKEVFIIWKQRRVAQMKFFCECCGGNGFIRPDLVLVSSPDKLSSSTRGLNGHGSSGK